MNQLLSAILAGILIFFGLSIYLNTDESGKDARQIIFTPSSFVEVFGSTNVSGDTLNIDGYEQGQAVVSSGNVSFEAESNPVLKYSIKVSQTAHEPIFFWRQKGSRREVSTITLRAGSKQLINLESAVDWLGEIVEVGFLFEDPEQQPARLAEVSLETKSLTSSLRLLVGGWTAFEPWSQKSINFLYGGTASPTVYLPLVVLAWFLLCAVIIFGLNRGRQDHLFPSIVILFVSAWMILDIRWTANQARQALRSFENLEVTSEQERLKNAPDGFLYENISRINREVLGESPQKVLILGENVRNEFLLLKTRYHFLPHSAAVKQRLDDSDLAGKLDYVFYLQSDLNREEFSGLGVRGDAWKQLPVSARWLDRLEVADIGELGILFSVTGQKRDGIAE